MSIDGHQLNALRDVSVPSMSMSSSAFARFGKMISDKSMASLSSSGQQSSSIVCTPESAFRSVQKVLNGSFKEVKALSYSPIRDPSRAKIDRSNKQPEEKNKFHHLSQHQLREALDGGLGSLILEELKED